MDYLLPTGFTICAWWLATAAVLRLNRLSGAIATTGLLLTSILAVAAIGGVIATRTSDSVTAIYCSFTCALILFAWHEVSYYAGLVSGPRPKACPEGVTGWQRFRFGVAASLYHELAIVATAALLFWWLRDGNTMAVWTFCLLWWMRWSAKLNIFLGVANLHAEFWPAHLRYLDSYVAHRSMNLLFPLSITVATTVLGAMIYQAFQLPPGSAQSTALLLLSSLLALAILEHWFLVLPIADDALWKWSTRVRSEQTPSESDSALRHAGVDPVADDAADAAIGPNIRVLPRSAP